MLFLAFITANDSRQRQISTMRVFSPLIAWLVGSGVLASLGVLLHVPSVVMSVLLLSLLLLLLLLLLLCCVSRACLSWEASSPLLQSCTSWCNAGVTWPQFSPLPVGALSCNLVACVHISRHVVAHAQCDS